MKWYRRLFLFSLLLSLIPLGPAAANQETIRITTGQWPPYLDENRPDGGFLSQIIREAFASQDIDVEFSFFPWSRALALVKSREYQASAVWSCTAERKREFLYSAPILPYQYVFYHRQKMPLDWDSLSDLRGMNVGLTQDYSYGDTLSGAIESGLVNADVTTSDIANFRKLLLERIDLFPMDPIVGEAMLAEQLGPEARESLEFHPRPLRSALYHLPFSREDPEAGRLKRAFDRGLAKLRESGRYQEIIEKALKAHSSPAAAEILEDKLVNWDEDPSTCD
ncbi:substrate-binding periplasmic protein [Marinobacter salsuginis]|uniref:substrate-binding periplasmic protein n=1 Tax=Marinobacter salsuginis TaxID=418719 RepID=UPI00273DF36F|nr:transporter substrate-binding domain-containing protein [Marinobacter salsuginis]